MATDASEKRTSISALIVPVRTTGDTVEDVAADMSTVGGL